MNFGERNRGSEIPYYYCVVVLACLLLLGFLQQTKGRKPADRAVLMVIIGTLLYSTACRAELFSTRLF